MGGELIKIGFGEINGAETQTVSARDLHGFLMCGDRLDQWIRRRIEKYRFIDSEDFCTELCKTSNGRPSTEFHLTIGMAKELCMVENNKKGQQARRYFIECERIAKEATAATIMPEDYPSALRALANEHEQKERLRLELIKNQPKIEFAESVRASEDGIVVREMARVLGTGIVRFNVWLTDEGIHKLYTNEPKQEFLERGIFVADERTRGHPHSGNKIPYVAYLVTGKGQVFLEKKWRESHAA